MKLRDILIDCKKLECPLGMRVVNDIFSEKYVITEVGDDYVKIEAGGDKRIVQISQIVYIGANDIEMAREKKELDAKIQEQAENADKYFKQREVKTNA